ncbi:TIGR02450 family Trp-rich protein [Photobacterium leiognathi]|uniref:TIGR02450 family Trp-rich protein n=1 Tax=Photobacterium leiognathi TaxID=553611 RepID=UPI002980B798|nr:TIGR02450 family Trp-rich protein [Photobacterium leiognathi]
MNRLSPKKLLNSKWTAAQPQNKEKHFIITDVETNESGEVLFCTMEAVMSKREFNVNWQDLKNNLVWNQGWK